MYVYINTYAHMYVFSLFFIGSLKNIYFTLDLVEC